MAVVWGAGHEEVAPGRLAFNGLSLSALFVVISTLVSLEMVMLVVSLGDGWGFCKFLAW